jgi:hypothetical protein
MLLMYNQYFLLASSQKQIEKNVNLSPAMERQNFHFSEAKSSSISVNILLSAIIEYVS